jgi:hypothetical protein
MGSEASDNGKLLQGTLHLLGIGAWLQAITLLVIGVLLLSVRNAHGDLGRALQAVAAMEFPAPELGFVFTLSCTAARPRGESL